MNAPLTAAPNASPFLSERDGLSPSRSQPNIAPSRMPDQRRPGQAIEGHGIIGSTNHSHLVTYPNNDPQTAQHLPPGFVNLAPLPDFNQNHQVNPSAQSFGVDHMARGPTVQRSNPIGPSQFLTKEQNEVATQANKLRVSHQDNFAIIGSQGDAPGGVPIQQHHITIRQKGETMGTVQLSEGDATRISPQPLTSVGSIGERRSQQQRQNAMTDPLSDVASSLASAEPSTLLEVQAVQGSTAESADVSAASRENAPSPTSYASKLMMTAPPKPQIVVQVKPRVAVATPPTAGGSLVKTAPKMVYNVKFKRSQRNFILGPRISREVKIGCYVKVEADRGEDLGIVMSVLSLEKHLESTTSRHRSSTEDSAASDFSAPSYSTNIGDMKRIIRVATHDEVSLLDVKRKDEDELLKICRAKVKQRGLPMTVVDAEYQFDRNKLIFFFQADGRIDFRELVRDLFSMYKTRIWMQQLTEEA